MSSGERQLIVNPLERAVSGDIVRAQSFIAAATNEVLRALLDTGAGLDDVQAGALSNPTLSSTSPASAEVFTGLLFQPTGTSVASVITAGTIGLYDPDTTPSTDDSQWKLIQDAGTSALTLTANVSGQLRVDVVECARVQPDAIVETDSRDVFNTVTGIFQAATVTKVSAAQLQYRIRLGTAGSGFPGTATGWVPLAVVSVPSATTTWDTTTIWDVRPLLEDRLFSLTTATRDLPLVNRCLAQVDALNFGGQSRLSGNIEAQLGNRRVGGMIRPSTPATASGDSTFYVDLDDVANQSDTAGDTGFNYVYLCTPLQLPRWARYQVGPGNRQPMSPRGLLLSSANPPDLVYGTPHVALKLPPCLQDSGSTFEIPTASCICVLARIGNSSDGSGGLIATGGVHWSNATTPVNSASISTRFGTWTLTPGTDFPAHARAVRMQITIVYTISGGSLTSYNIPPPTFGIRPEGDGNFVVVTPDGVPYVYGPTGPTYSNTQTITTIAVVRIPLCQYYGLLGQPGLSTPGDAATFNLHLTTNPMATGAGTLALTSASFTVQGWELLDAD